MEIGMLPLPAKLKGKLISAGYTMRSCIAAVSPADLARELKVSESDALEILGHVAAGVPHGDPFISGSRTAWDMLNEEALLQRITTSSADLDYMLDGGISRGQVTEIGGVPGIGKTQMGIQLAVNVQIPVDCGGLGGKAIYIDTEGSFMLERVLQIAEACIDDLGGSYTKASQSRLHAQAFLENIFYFRVCCSIEQIALINYLDKFISEQRDIQIVIIDSVTFHFRHDFDDLGLRTRILGEMALKLMKLAHKFRLAVVLLNQVTTKYTEGSLQMTLALGDSWSHACTNRIILHWNGDERYAYIAKSLSLKSAAAPYTISGRGIRDSKPGDDRIKG